jgi:6-phosphogluconolactonase
MVTLRRFADLGSVESAAYELLAEEAVKPGPAALLLSGGSTPFGLYGRIAERPFDVNETCHVVLSDERMVPFDSPESNVGRMLGMLKALRLPARRVLCAAPEDTAETAAWRYDATLRRYFTDGGHLRVALLGLGQDGHTAGLFSAEDVARGKGHMAIPVRRPDGVEGVTVTRELLMKADRMVFLVAGPAKLDAVKWLCAGRKTLVAGIVAADHPQAEVWYTEQELPAAAGARKKKCKEGDDDMTAKCGAKASHKGHLCVLASELKFDQIKELVTNPKFMCFNCGRVADSKKNLCNPMLLKD